MNALIIAVVCVLLGITAFTTLAVRECRERFAQEKNVEKAQKWLDEQQGKSIDYDD